MPQSKNTYPTNAQIYTLPTFALLLSIATLIVIVLAEIQTKNVTRVPASEAFTSIANQNGFTGVVNGQIATLSTNVSGLLSGNAGSVQAATDEQVRSVTMQDFDGETLSASTENISANDTILDGFQRGCVLNQTKLGVDFTPIVSRIQSSDTLSTCFQKTQGILTSRQNLFTVVEEEFPLVGSAWDDPANGSNILPAGFWKTGTAIRIDSHFEWFTGGLPLTAEYKFGFNDQTVSVFMGHNGFFTIMLSIVLVAQSATSINVHMTLFVNGRPQSAGGISQTLTIDSNTPTNLTLIAIGTEAFRLKGAVASVLYQT